MIAMDWVGRVIDGRYVVEALIGRGGMGVVLAARHKFTGARVAVKMVRSDLGLDREIESRFLAEARIPATIGHRSVVKTLDAGKTPDGELYLVMELLAGRSLRHEIMRGVGAPSVRRIGMELLDVLAAAHARGVVHRDVKPENVFLVEPDASVKLLVKGQPDPIRLAMPSATPYIEAFFARALERDPARRFASAAEMAVALARLPLAASAPDAPPASNPAATIAVTTRPARPPATQRERRGGTSPAKNPAADTAGRTAGPAASTPAAPPLAMGNWLDPDSGSSSTEARQSADTCAAGCKMLAGCRLGSTSCEADCAQNRTLHGCLQQAASDCTRFASCWFGSSCRVAPSGTHSCSEAMDCEARCRNDMSCICSCVAGLSAGHAVALLAYNGCALPCRDKDCILQRCAAQARRCRAE
jgi:hypothetical protein